MAIKIRSYLSYLLKNKKLLFSLIFLIICLVIYLSFGWLQRTYYAHEAKSALNSELLSLKQPLDVLGFKNFKAAPVKCSTLPVYSYNAPQLQCITTIHNFVTIGQDNAPKLLFVAKAKQLDQLLANDKWQTSGNTANTLNQWFKDITSGKDWSTDIDSVKNFGDKHCSLVFNVAYSNPSPPAYEISMSCSSPILEKLKSQVTF